MEKVIAIGILGLLAIRVKQKVKAVYAFRYYPAGVPKVLFQGGSAVIAIPVQVRNESAESFQISRVYGRLFLNGSFISDFDVLDPVNLSGYGSAVFTIQFTVPILGAVIALVRAITDGLGRETIQVRATAKVSAVNVPVIFDYKL